MLTLSFLAMLDLSFKNVQILKVKFRAPSNFSIRDQASMSQTKEASIDNLPTFYTLLICFLCLNKYHFIKVTYHTCMY